MASTDDASIRFASYNASLFRETEGQLIEDLSTPDNTQAQTVAEIIQRSHPDVILVNEFDFDADGTAAELFHDNYLAVSQNGADPIDYPYVYVAPSNTGIPSGFDLNNNGVTDTTPGDRSYGDDALGFGVFPGQYGMVLYSKYPIVEDDIRTFQNFLWKDMPDALLPDDLNTPEPNDWYSPEELEVFRLSSKNHWDIPIDVNGEIVHVLASHPTPPSFDGPEDRNGKRNHDEIRFWADYITPGEGDYIYDDAGNAGGLDTGSSFVVMGDQNADPFDGNSIPGAIQQLLDNPLVNTSVTPFSRGGIEQALLQGDDNLIHTANPSFDTADFSEPPGNLRVDYVLPSQDLEITDAAVFWPTTDDPLFPLVGTFPFPSSDHRLVWADVDPSTRIHDIQGVAHISPLVGEEVSRVPGIVTALRDNGFYLQEPNPDDNDATSEGIFVFTDSEPTVSIGDSLLVDATVSEFRPGGDEDDNGNLSTTQLVDSNITVLSSDNPLPNSTIIGRDGRIPPTETIYDDADGDNVENTDNAFNPEENGLDFYESLEGMLVQVNDTVVVGPTNNFGEIYVLADNGADATGRTPRDGIIISPDDFNPERIQVDDEDVGILSPESSPEVNVSDRLGTVTGVIDYSFGNYELLYTEPLSVTPGELEPETTKLTGTEKQLAIASYNVENLDPGDTENIDIIAAQIANNLNSPDIIALQEIQDNTGSVDDGVVDASESYTALIDAIVAAGGPTYEFRDISPVDGEDGGQPGGNIRVGYLFNRDRVDFVDRTEPEVDLSTTSTTVTETDSGVELSLSPGRIDPNNPAFEDSRKPLVGEFIFNDEQVFVINNHFTSKGGSDPLFGRFQPPENGGEEQRAAQAQVVNDFVDDILAVDPNANIVVLGDLNEFQFFEPLQILEGDVNGQDPVLTNLTNTLPENQRYSYIFQGNSQALDHILVSDNLFKGAKYDAVHVNSEFADQVSDHDPLVAQLNVY
jgi:predicted extracellular nuclease